MGLFSTRYYHTTRIKSELVPLDITMKVNLFLTNGIYNKRSICEELDITRPTLDTRLVKHNWRKLEGEWITKLATENKI